MNRLRIPTLALATFTGLAMTLFAPAQQKPPPPALPPATECLPDASCKKVAVPVIENAKRTCIRYDCKEEDYCPTKCVHTSIWSRFCGSCCGKDGCGQGGSDPGHQCGHPRTRKVLIKEIVTEEVPTPKCKVERVSEPCPPAQTAPVVPAPGEPIAPPVDSRPPKP
ncbi:MAG: hypothetical protein K2R98_16845 [Gemmataceae bacterium]|nr:hypothetical protein [Gemmataceae bacterium]